MWILSYLWWTGSTQLHRISLGLCSHMEILENSSEGFVGYIQTASGGLYQQRGTYRKHRLHPVTAHPNSLRVGTDWFTHILPLPTGMLCALCKCTHFSSVFTTNQNHCTLEFTCCYATETFPYLQLIWMSNSNSHVLLQYLHLQQQW